MRSQFHDEDRQTHICFVDDVLNELHVFIASKNVMRRTHEYGMWWMCSVFPVHLQLFNVTSCAAKHDFINEMHSSLLPVFDPYVCIVCRSFTNDSVSLQRYCFLMFSLFSTVQRELRTTSVASSRSAHESSHCHSVLMK